MSTSERRMTRSQQRAAAAAAATPEVVQPVATRALSHVVATEPVALPGAPAHGDSGDNVMMEDVAGPSHAAAPVAAAAPHPDREAFAASAGAASPRTFQAKLAGWMWDIQSGTGGLGSLNQRVSATEGRVHKLSGGMDSLRTSVVQAHDSAHYAARDHRRILLGGDPILHVFATQGAHGVRLCLGEWVNSFRSQVDPAARDWRAELSSSVIFKISFPNGGDRLTVDLPHKLCRDELCQQLGCSPLRRQQWANVTVRARLTASEEANRKRVLAAFQVQSGTGQVAWVEGRRVFFAADEAVVLTAGSPPFRIPLGLHEQTVSALIAKVRQLVPEGTLDPIGGIRGTQQQMRTLPGLEAAPQYPGPLA